jgi:hypothetical protein
MAAMNKPNQNAGLWWTSIVSLSLGLAVYVLLKPANYDPDIERYRSMALVSSFAISGLCIIIATRKRWFGKGL